MSVIGIDPGTTGAAVLIHDDRGIETIRFMRHTRKSIYTWFTYNDNCENATIENVHAIPKDRKQLSQFAKFMQEVGGVKWAMNIAGIGYDEVDPQTWQREFALGGMSRADKGKQGKRIAQALYPMIKVTNDLWAAILIAEYARRKRYGELTNGRDKNKTPRKAQGIRYERDQSGSVV